ncbi:MAG: hypothetical protein GY820_09175 [Gammaproteobacteria bacterium]|nr:hypothetical protein [Gammaproteobacteria bacterium]
MLPTPCFTVLRRRHLQITAPLEAAHTLALTKAPGARYYARHTPARVAVIHAPRPCEEGAGVCLA